MKVTHFTISILFLFISCSSIPKIHQDPAILNMFIFKNCHEPFLKSHETNIHSIQATMHGKKATPFIGITKANPQTKKIHSALTSIEGLVLFEAVNDKGLKIKRAVKPFDSENFARGLMDDINLIFFKPEGVVNKIGVLKNGSMICRYQKQEKTTDVIYNELDGWIIKVYFKNKLKKKVSIARAKNSGNPENIQLSSMGKIKYKLDLKLIKRDKN